jgi:hypothetical protein
LNNQPIWKIREVPGQREKKKDGLDRSPAIERKEGEV